MNKFVTEAEGFLKTKRSVTLYTGAWLVIGIVVGIALMKWIL